MRYIPLLFFLITLIRCANIIPPEGGPRDTIPPTLVKSIPENESRNFSGDKILLEFDEWIQLKNAKEEIVITPSMGKNTKFLFKKNLVTILPENQLDTATTYSLAFRESIQDLNEGNPAEDLKLAFSTGKILDSLSIAGTVFNILEGRELEKLSVAIYTSDTFDIAKHAPSYISRTDKIGRFSITNLKAGNYFIYAWEDKNKNLKVETNTEKFGTHPAAIQLPSNKDSIKIPVVKLDSRPLKLNNYRNISNYSIIRLNKAPSTYRLKPTNSKKKLISHLGDSPNEIIAYPPDQNPDSLEVRLTAEDSLYNKIDSTFFIKQTKAKPIKESFSAKVTKAKYTAALKLFESEISLTLPLSRMNADSILIVADSLPRYSLTMEDIRIDTIRRTLHIKKTINLPDSLLAKTPTLVLKNGSLFSIFSDTLKTTESRIVPRFEKDLSTVTITAPIKKTNWYIEAIDDKFAVIDRLPHNKIVTFKHLDPTSTKFRAFEDLNGNGVWDANNPLKKISPEPIVFYMNEKKERNVPLRANWIVELEWIF